MESSAAIPFLYTPRKVQVRPYTELCSYVSTKSGENIGEVKFSTTNALYPGAVFISHININEGYRRLGYASKLLTSLISFFKAQGKTSFVVNIASENEKSIGLFEKHGFVVKEKMCVLTLVLELPKISGELPLCKSVVRAHRT